MNKTQFIPLTIPTVEPTRAFVLTVVKVLLEHKIPSETVLAVLNSLDELVLDEWGREQKEREHQIDLARVLSNA